MTPTDAFYLGAIGKLAATSITYPYITVKSRAHVATKNQPVDGMWKSLNKIVKEEGVAGLYKGNSNFLTAENDLTFADLYVICRNWTESQPERAYSCIPVCL